MNDTKEWWHRMFQMHTQLMENFDADLLLEFRQQLDSLPPYTYAKPREGLGIGARFVKEIAGWFDNVSQWYETKEDYDAAVTYLERALDYYTDPILDYHDDIIDEAKDRMRKLVTKTVIGIYEGCHDIYDDEE